MADSNPGKTAASRDGPAAAATAIRSRDDSPSAGTQVRSQTRSGDAPPSTLVGAVLKDRFFIETEIARGGMGVVYLARDGRREEAQDRNPHVALKVLSDEFRTHPDSLLTLQRETTKAQKLAHPNIVTVFDFDRDGDTVFMTMEYLKGQTLDGIIESQKKTGMPRERAFEIISGMAQGLAYAHKMDIVHSDFKPGNVFVTDEGVVKILDFGIAQAVKKTTTSQDTTVFNVASLGALTYPYASCEMFAGADPDPRNDIYALACVAYELLSGRHPFGTMASVDARDNELTPKPLEVLSGKQWAGLARGLAFDLDKRTPTVEEFLRELRQDPVDNRGKKVAGFAVALAFVAVIAAGLWATQAPSVIEEPVPPPRALNEEEQARVDSFLELAEVHMDVGRFAAPSGSSAFDAYRLILDIDPGNEAARNGIGRIAEYYAQAAREAGAAGRMDEARQLLELGRTVAPNHRGLAAVARQIGVP